MSGEKTCILDLNNIIMALLYTAGNKIGILSNSKTNLDISHLLPQLPLERSEANLSTLYTATTKNALILIRSKQRPEANFSSCGTADGTFYSRKLPKRYLF